MPLQPPTSILDVLKRARAILTKRWTQHRYYHQKTQCYCATGAIYRAAGFTARQVLEDRQGSSLFKRGLARKTVKIVEQQLSRLFRTPRVGYGLEGYGLEGYNDNHTHAEVLNLFDETIKAEERRT